MTELQKYHLSMDIQIPKEMNRESVEEYIRSQIFVGGWGESFRSNYIHADRFSFTHASTEPMYLISESEIDDLCLTSIDTGVYNPGDAAYEAACEKRMQTKHNIFTRGPVAQPAPDCFNDISGDGACEHAADPENGGEIPVCTIIGTSCCRQEIVDARPSFYQIYCRSSKHDAAIAAQEREKRIEFLTKIRNMVDDTKDLSDQYREEGISSCVQSELTDIINLIEGEIKSLLGAQ